MKATLTAGLLLAAIFLTGCTVGTFSKIDQIEKGVIEPRVDATYDETVKRWCRMPVDIHNRAIGRSTITPRSLTDNCPEWRAIRDALVGDTMNRLGIGPVQ